MVSVKKIWHHDQFQIGIGFGFDETLKQKARQIGANWSQTYKCCYVDYNKENYQKITSKFPDLEILYNTPTKVEAILGQPGLLPPDYFTHEVPTSKQGEIIIETFILKKNMTLAQLPEISAIINQVKRFGDSRYSKANQCYLLPAAPAVLLNLSQLAAANGLTLLNRMPENYLNKRYVPVTMHFETTIYHER